VEKPKDVAQCVLFLISENSRFITGIDIAVDGGLTSVLVGALQFNLNELSRVKKEGERARDWLSKFEKVTCRQLVKIYSIVFAGIFCFSCNSSSLNIMTEK